MEKEWSELNKKLQEELKKENTFLNGIDDVIYLRKSLMEEIIRFKETYVKNDYSSQPFINNVGLQSKTVAYSLWHIFRIEDIVVNTLILDKEEVLFKNNYKEKINSSIITTGNELEKEKIREFSLDLNIDELFNYINNVYQETNIFLKSLSFIDSMKTFNNDDKERIKKLKVVSENDKAFWLIDYWTGKDILGLIKMPLTRHWIMHIEASRRILKKVEEDKLKLVKKARKNLNPISYCSNHCDYCFLAKWCGGCRSNYNVCSYATICDDGICPNVKCAKSKDFKSCYECHDLLDCKKGFYDSNSRISCKATALFINKYGENEYTLTLKKAISQGMNYASDLDKKETIQDAFKCLESFMDNNGK